MSIGERLKEARKKKKLSQDALAERIGTSRGVITNIEHDKVKEPQTMVINAVCDVLGIRREWLLTGDGPMDRPAQPPADQDVMSEIYQCMQGLSENDQLYILETIKTYISHVKK